MTPLIIVLSILPITIITTVSVLLLVYYSRKGATGTKGKLAAVNSFHARWQTLAQSLGGSADPSGMSFTFSHKGVLARAHVHYNKGNATRFQISFPAGLGDPASEKETVARELSTRRKEADLEDYINLPAGVDGRDPVPWKILLRAERSLDRLGKRLGINREVQTGNEEFDGKVYIETDAPDQMVQKILSEKAVRARVMAVTSDPNRSVTFYTGVGVVVERQAPDESSLDQAFFGSMLDTAVDLSRAMKPLAFRPRKPAVLTPTLVLIILSYLAIPAGIVWLIMSINRWPLLDWFPVLYGIGAGYALWFLFVFILAAVVRGRSNSLRILLIWLGALVIACPVAGAAGLLTANGKYDRKKPETHRVEVESAYYRTSKNRTTYFVRVRSWKKDGSLVSFKVKREIYEWVRRRNHGVKPWAEITVHPGRLGFPWYEPLRVGQY